jgi:hypothetical protein
VWVRPEVSFAFGGVLGDSIDFSLVPALDGHNFGMLFADSVLGRVEPGCANPLLACDMEGRDVTDRYFAVRPDGAVVVTEDVTPTMMVTTAQQAVRDCLFYVSRRRA